MQSSKVMKYGINIANFQICCTVRDTPGRFHVPKLCNNPIFSVGFSKSQGFWPLATKVACFYVKYRKG